MNPQIETRPAGSGDRDFLRELYAATRDDVQLLPWPPAERAAFLDMQFEAQYTDYRNRFPGAEHSIIEEDGRPIGRIWIDRRADEIRLLDIALLPDRRNSGIGTSLLRALMSEASESTTALRHSVFKTNVGAIRLYERLGFEVIEDFEMYVLMEWQGPLSG